MYQAVFELQVVGKERFDGLLASWDQEVAQLLAGAGQRIGAEGARTLEALRRAGPLHNIEATRKILRSLTTTTAPTTQP